MLNFINILIQITDSINGFIYSNILFWVLIAVGVYFTIRTGFVQIRLFPEAILSLIHI